MTDIFSYLSRRPYPGRGILLGATPAARPVCAYFIMGRSENSRNRVFEATADGIRTHAFDDKRLTDPALIIYHPLRRFNGVTIITNGDQTDTIRDMLASGGTVYDALATRRFEPDAPNFTPRISGVADGGSYLLSILKTPDGKICERCFYSYETLPGAGHFISTYEGFASPLPSFSGEPIAVELGDMTASELADALWDALDEDNRVSLFVSVGGESVIINKNGGMT